MKTDLDDRINAMLALSRGDREIARRLVFYDSNYAFAGDPQRGFDILNEIAMHFRLPFSAIHVTGSAQFGYSYFSERDFTPQQSDLDIAIISADLFSRYSEHCYWITGRYKNLVGFPSRQGIDVSQQFRNYLSEGYFRPDLMPRSKLRDDWFAFFNQLSNKCSDLFKNVNGGLFLSDSLLEMRNTNLVAECKKGAQ